MGEESSFEHIDNDFSVYLSTSYYMIINQK